MNIPLWAYTLPYVEGGRGVEGVDCWGLVLRLYKHFYDIELTEYPNITLPSLNDCQSTSEQLKTELKTQRLFQEVPCPEFGDIVLLKVRGEPLHIGFCLDKQTMIHTTKRQGVTIENFMEMKWNNKIAGFYRKM